MTLQLKLPVVFTDPNLPVFGIDPVLPRQGALWLVDFQHPASPAPLTAIQAGVVVDVPNLAWGQAAAMIGSGTATTLSPTLNNGGNTDGLAKVELSGKGGIHSITSQVSDPGQARGLYLEFSTGAKPLMAEYMRSHDHDYYYSVWARITRPMLTTSGAVTSFIQHGNYAGGFTSNYRALMGINYSEVGAGGIAGRYMANTLGATHGSAMSHQWTGNKGTDVSSTLLDILNLGTEGVFNYTPALRQAVASAIGYRSYCEDLTVSGRTYAQVDALDHAQFTADCLTPGGRYYGDTFTNPSTIP